MSEHQLMIQKKNEQPNEEDDNDYGIPVIDVFEADRLNELAIQQSLRDNYKSLEFPCCGDYLEPSLRPIIEKKKEKGKQLYDQIGNQLAEHNKTLQYDGIFDNSQVDEMSQKEQIRLKSRIIRDLRQQYFQQNSEFISDNQFFHNHLSRLANISSENNDAIGTLQKNAILSERNNQKKSMPFQLQINVGFIWISKHDLQNSQENKFQELRPLLNKFSVESAYPTLAQISRQIDFLKKTRQKMEHSQASNQQIEEVENKIKMSSQIYKQEVTKLQQLMQNIIRKWRQVKEERRVSQMQTVPWKLNIKQYEIDGQRSFDIGVIPCQVSQRPTGPNADAELRRRQQIRDERYMIKIYINGNQVARSQKVHLQWPSFRVMFNSKFSVTVYSAPSSIQVEVIKVGIINQTVDTIHLTLPGVNSKTITASQSRFAGANFSSNGPKARKKEQEPISPAGMVVYRIEWKGQGSRMPPVSFKSQQEETAATQTSEQVNLDYLKLYDIMDPRIHQRSKRQKVDDEIVKTQGALLPFIDTQSARHLFLKMKATQPQFERLQIPLTQQQIQKRPDLLAVLEREKSRTLNDARIVSEQIYNPAEGIFKMQDKQILDQIKKILYQIQNLKINMLKGNSSAKYKITQQIIKEYVFEQMESPIVVFFKNLFTQKRKLGPLVTYYLQAKNVRDTMEVNIHFRSAKNIPIRAQALQRLKNQEQRDQSQEQHRAMLMRMGAHTGNVQMFTNYGMSMHRAPPHMNMQGRNFFIPGMPMQNMNLEVHYPRQKIERNNTCMIMNFKKLIKKTETLQGPFPEWNQTIDFEYNLNAEQMTVGKLYSNNQKLIKLFLFDIKQQSKPTTAISEKRIKKTKFYLGRIDIPMSMLVAIPSLTGIFPIERPLIIFGYGVKKATGFDLKQMDQQTNKTEHPSIQTMTNLDMFSDPLIDSMTAYNEDRKFVTGAHKQSTIFLQRASDWLSDLNTKTYIRIWLNNIDGRSVFICKYLSDVIMPPQELQNSIERCARFVSLIPRKYNCRLLENTQEFHLTCEQMLRIKMGEDHGILLCNFFKFIDKRANRNNIESYLVLGKAFPYGKSIFVLRRNIDTGDSELWDPYAGHCYFMPAKQYDTYCCFFKYPQKRQLEEQKDFCCMIQIGSIVTSSNVYVNIQDTFRPEQIDFNIYDEKLWKPFLTQRMRAQYFDHSVIESIQPQIDADFYPKPKQLESGIEKELQKFILKKMQSQRLSHFTNYTLKQNTSISSLIYNKLLPKCENFLLDFRTTGLDSTLYNSSKKMQYTKALQQLQYQKTKINENVDSDKMLYGVTLNMAYTTKQQIWQKVQQTHIHLNEQQNLQFCVVVKCFQIACNLISVWIFVGSISLV